MSAGRSRVLGDAVQLLAWLSQRRAPFSIHDLGEVLPTVTPRTRYRWLVVLEGAGLIEIERANTSRRRQGKGRLGFEHEPTLWRSSVRKQAAA